MSNFSIIKYFIQVKSVLVWSYNSSYYSSMVLQIILLLNGRTLISTRGYDSFLIYGVSKTSHSSRTFRRILLVCIKRFFCNSVIFVSIPMVFNLFSRALAGVPRAPTTNRTTGTLTFYIFFSSLASFKYLPIFSTSLSSSLVSYRHSLTMCLIVSSALLHILHFACSCDFSIFSLVRLV